MTYEHEATNDELQLGSEQELTRAGLSVRDIGQLDGCLYEETEQDAAVDAWLAANPHSVRRSALRAR